MNSIQENKLSMYFKVKVFFNENINSYSTIPLVANRVTTFNLLLDNFILHEAIAAGDSTGYTLQKDKYRDKLREKTLIATAAIASYAEEAGNELLRNEFSLPLSTIASMRDMDELIYFKKVNAEITNDSTRFFTHGIDTNFVTEFGALCDEYAEHAAATGNIKAKKVAAGNKVDRLFEEIDAVLTNGIDPLIDTTKSSLDVLYDQYYNVRSIDSNAASSSSTPDILLTLTPNSTMVANTQPYQASRSFKVKNKGNDEIEWGLSTNGTIFTFAKHQIAAGGTSTKLSSTLGASGDYLLFQNPTNNPVDIEITIEE